MDSAVDFFISYTHADQAWAEWIAWQLEANGYTTMLQAWDFIPGRDFVHQMQQAARNANRTIAVLSAAYLTSRFGEAEWRAAFTQDPTGEHGLLVPVRVAKVSPPGLLATRIYIDLVGVTDERSATDRLLQGLSRRRIKPPQPPAFPGRTPLATAQASQPVPPFPPALPSRRQPRTTPRLARRPPRAHQAHGRPTGRRWKPAVLPVGVVLLLILALAAPRIWSAVAGSSRAPQPPSFDQAQRRLASPQLTERLRAVGDLIRIAESTNTASPATCRTLVAFIKAGLPFPQRDYKDPQLAPLQTRAPDRQQALTGLSRLDCADRIPGQVRLITLDLRRADLRDGRLGAATFSWTQFWKADLSSAHLDQADFTGAHLESTLISGASLVGAQLDGANLEDAQLRRADLRRASMKVHVESTHPRAAVLVNADLRDADLREANLDGAELMGARLQGARLQAASLRGADLTGATADATTTWPAGFDPRRAHVTLSQFERCAAYARQSARAHHRCWAGCPTVIASTWREYFRTPPGETG